MEPIAREILLLVWDGVIIIISVFVVKYEIHFNISQNVIILAHELFIVGADNYFIP